MKRRKEIRINSTLDELYLVEQFIEQVTDEFLLHDSYFGSISVAVTEAVRNAILHGNGGDASKKVHILLDARREGLWISVVDQGDGFDYRKYMDNLDILNLTNPEQRGLTLMRALADEVRFQNKGRVVEMLFRITGIDKNIQEDRVNRLHQFFRISKHAGG